MNPVITNPVITNKFGRSKLFVTTKFECDIFCGSLGSIEKWVKSLTKLYHNKIKLVQIPDTHCLSESLIHTVEKEGIDYDNLSTETHYLLKKISLNKNLQLFLLRKISDFKTLFGREKAKMFKIAS